MIIFMIIFYDKNKNKNNQTSQEKIKIFTIIF